MMPLSDKFIIATFVAAAAEHLENEHMPPWFIPDATASLRRVVTRELDHWRTIGRSLRTRDAAMFVAGQQTRRGARW